MKKLLFSLVAMAAMVVSAAQCCGTTQKGERCKREADEGSKYCIGHKDQAKNPLAKDDGTCWAITQNDSRCKNKKDGASDYCKLHAVKKVAKSPDKCRAMTFDGRRCSREPLEGYNYCKQHCEGGAAAEKKPVAKK